MKLMTDGDPSPELTSRDCRPVRTKAGFVLIAPPAFDHLKPMPEVSYAPKESQKMPPTEPSVPSLRGDERQIDHKKATGRAGDFRLDHDRKFPDRRPAVFSAGVGPIRLNQPLR